MIVDGNMQILAASAISRCSVAVHAMADTIDFREFFDVDMDDFARRFALVTQGFGRRQDIAFAAEPRTF